MSELHDKARDWSARSKHTRYKGQVQEAEAIISALLIENGRLQREFVKSERRAIAFGDVIQSHVIAMRAAVVAAANESPGRGIEWIQNTLRGPGHLPNIDAETSAQALWDRETAEHETFRAKHPAPEKPAASNGWYCAHCQSGVDPSEVTFNEAHTVCGRIISDDEPPASAVPDEIDEPPAGVVMQTNEMTYAYTCGWNACRAAMLAAAPAVPSVPELPRG